MYSRFQRIGPLVGLLLVTPLALPAQQDESAAVLSAVDSLFHGMRTRDTALVRRVFEPGARLVGMRPRGFQGLTVDQFVNFIARDTRGEWLERAFDPEVRIDGTLATVWAAYDFHLAGQPTHCGVDAVQLLKMGASWRIVGLADTYVVEGCPPRPAPGSETAGTDPAAELRREMQELADAWNRNDLAGHVAAYGDSAVFMVARGPLIGRERIRASLERSFWVDGKPRQQLRFEEIEIRMLGSRDARVMGRFVLFGGGLAEASGRFTTIWEKIDGRWRIIHDHSS
jgi:uncharacterized protein (TIGR02246 family)